VIAIAAGVFNSLALKGDGTVVAWGRDNWFGQCNVHKELANVTAIAMGWSYGLALKDDGTVAEWGWDDFDGEYFLPSVLGLTDVTAIAAGYCHSLVLKDDGTVVAWGVNWDGQCDVPAGLTDVVAIACGHLHSLALKRDGTVVAWGDNWDGQCDVPDGLTNVVAISAGGYHSLAIVPSGATTQSPRPVPHWWLRSKFPNEPDTPQDWNNLVGNDYGTPYTVWQSYVIGFKDPTDPNNRFRATIKMDNGWPWPDITFVPDLREARKYTLLSTSTLTPPDWREEWDWWNPGDMRFFKVNVDLWGY
jgi:hypothetical protein